MNEQRQVQLNEAMERLSEQDRITMEARTLPTDRKLTPDETGAIRGAVMDVVFDGRNRVIHNTKLAKEIGYAASVVSQWLGGNYTGNVEAVTRAMNHWLERRARREESVRPQVYVSTWVCETMKATISMAHRRCKMAAIVAPAGSGKDMVIQAVADRYNAIVLYAVQDSMTPRELLLELAGKLDLRLSRGSIANLLRKIVETIRGRDRIIIINEAQQLRNACAPIVRAIYDQADTPIILIGADKIFELIDDRASGRSSGGGQFSRRCIRMNVADRAASETDPSGRSKTVGRPLFTTEEVRKFLAARELKLTPEAFTLAVTVANLDEHGTFGLMKDVCESASDMYGSDKPLTRNQLLAAMTLLLGEGEYTSAMVAVRRIEDGETRIAAAG